MPFEFKKTELDGVILVKSKIFEDNRGSFMENYKKTDFQAQGINDEFVQENYSFSNKKVLRGVHYQVAPFAQAKLIRCIIGRINDIVVDLRPQSKTFKKWISIELSQENSLSIYLPKGFGHGFVTLSENAQVSYKTTEEYAPVAERGLIWNDKELNINWGIDFEPILSEKDKNLPKLSEIDKKEL